MAKKNEEELDYTKQPQATNQEEVDAQDTRTRLYQSLGYSYGQQQEQSDKSYDQAISQQDRTLLSRGMQRSSYGMSTLANLQNQKVKERNRIGEAMIADYQSRLSQLEEAEEARKFQTSEREAQQAYNTSERIAQQQYSTSEREAQQGYSTSERLAQQQYSTAEREAQQAFSAEQSALERAQQESQFAEQMALQREQMAQSSDQFEQQMALEREKLDYDKMSTDQQLVFNYIETALKNGSDVSDELLARVGMTRADFNLAKKSAGGRSSSKKTTTGDDTTNNPAQTSTSFLDALNNFGQGLDLPSDSTPTPSEKPRVTAPTSKRGTDSTTMPSGTLDKIAYLYESDEDISKRIK